MSSEPVTRMVMRCADGPAYVPATRVKCEWCNAECWLALSSMVEHPEAHLVCMQCCFANPEFQLDTSLSEIQKKEIRDWYRPKGT